MTNKVDIERLKQFYNYVLSLKEKSYIDKIAKPESYGSFVGKGSDPFAAPEDFWFSVENACTDPEDEICEEETASFLAAMFCYENKYKPMACSVSELYNAVWSYFGLDVNKGQEFYIELCSDEDDTIYPADLLRMIKALVSQLEEPNNPGFGGEGFFKEFIKKIDLLKAMDSAHVPYTFGSKPKKDMLPLECHNPDPLPPSSIIWDEIKRTCGGA